MCSAIQILNCLNRNSKKYVGLIDVASFQGAAHFNSPACLQMSYGETVYATTPSGIHNFIVKRHEMCGLSHWTRESNRRTADTPSLDS